MAAPEIAVVIDDPPALESLTLSPDARATLVIRLMGEIVVTGIPEDDHDPRADAFRGPEGPSGSSHH